MSQQSASQRQPLPDDDIRIETRQFENRFKHRLSLPEASNFDEKRIRDMGNMYAAYNMMVRTASPVVNGQNSERPLRMGNPSVIGKKKEKRNHATVLNSAHDHSVVFFFYIKDYGHSLW